jgi:hypothetical protein
MLKVVPLSLKQMNEFITQHHRHHKVIRGHRFSIGAIDGNGKLVGACSVGRPVARGCDPYRVAEVTRLVTDGSKNACSLLYGAAARACKAMGYVLIQTYILDSEIGTSLKASGWRYSHKTYGRQWTATTGTNRSRRTDQPNCDKQCWVRVLNMSQL